jgi:glycosyltransferase involved in cell wall biosynthesis
VPVRVLDGGRAARALKLRRWLENDRIDLVHAWLFIADAYAWVATRWTGRPLLTSARNCKRQGHMLGVLTRCAFAASRAIVVNSHDVAAYIVRRYRAPQDRIRVIYNGIDTERFRPASNGCGDRGPIVSVGRLVEQKNHALFLRAAARLARQVAGARFVIVGDGPLRPALEVQAQALGIGDRVAFTGERHDVETVLRTASLFWLTSCWEGMPNVVLEAMASGVPVIATDVGGTRELVRSAVDGFVVTEEDEEGFVARSRDLLGNETRRRQFAAAARVRAEEFSCARMVNAISQLYDEILLRRRTLNGVVVKEQERDGIARADVS